MPKPARRIEDAKRWTAKATLPDGRRAGGVETGGIQASSDTSAVRREPATRYLWDTLVTSVELRSADRSKHIVARMVIPHADNLGASYGANLAFLDLLRRKAVTCGSVMVPGAWFREIVEAARCDPSLDVGVHLTLTSE